MLIGNVVGRHKRKTNERMMWTGMIFASPRSPSVCTAWEQKVSSVPFQTYCLREFSFSYEKKSNDWFKMELRLTVEERDSLENLKCVLVNICLILTWLESEVWFDKEGERVLRM